VGDHEAWLPGRHRDRVRFRVAQPRVATFTSPAVDAGWMWKGATEWPRRWEPSSDSTQGRVRGPVIEGSWPPAELPDAVSVPAEHLAVQLAVALRNPAAAGCPSALRDLIVASENHHNLIVRQLARAVRPHASARQG